MAAGSLAAALGGDGALLGLIVKMPQLRYVEAAGLAGFDVVVLDGEHGPADDQLVDQHILAARAGGAEVLVRVAGPGDPSILRVLDAGAAGIVVPHVSTVDEARRAVGAAHYPPLGRRGFAVTTRAGAYGRRPAAEHVRRARQETVVIVQVEDREGVDAVQAIVAVEGVAGVFPGPADLAADLGVVGRPDAPELREALDRVATAVAHRDGVALCSLAADAPAAAAALRGGARLALLVLDDVVLPALFTLNDAARPAA